MERLFPILVIKQKHFNNSIHPESISRCVETILFTKITGMRGAYGYQVPRLLKTRKFKEKPNSRDQTTTCS
jgi:hypothetical protein